MKTWTVIIPIAGHAFVTVKAETEEAAIDQAFQEATLDHVDEWEALKRFNQGNVCHCLSPWEVEVVCEDGDVEDAPA